MTLRKERKSLGSALGLVLLATALTGCGGDEPKAGSDAKTTESSAATEESAEGEAEGEDAVTDDGADAEASGEELTGQAFCTAMDDAFALEDQTEFVTALKAIEPPAELATDWSTVVTATEGMVVEGKDLSPENPEDAAKIEAMLTKYATPEVDAATTKIEEYEAANCETGTE